MMQRSLQQCLELAEVLEAQDELLPEVDILALHAADRRACQLSAGRRYHLRERSQQRDGDVTLGGVR